MLNFNQAVAHWTQNLNAWYAMNATADEVAEAFEDAFLGKKAYDGRSYIDVFLKRPDGSWQRYLDTADRETLADQVEINRGNGPLPTYADLGGNLLNKVPR